VSPLLNTGKNSKRVYKSALIGAMFGVFNVFYVFVPFLTFLAGNKLLITLYSITGVLILLSLICVLVFFRNEYSYNLSKLRYLLFLSVYTLIFYVGLGVLMYKSLSAVFFTTDTYFMVLYVILSVMSSWDMLSSVKKGLAKVRRFYTRTYKMHILYNVIVVACAILTGIILLLPQILIAG